LGFIFEPRSFVQQLLHYRNQSSPRLNQFANFPQKESERMLVEYALLALAGMTQREQRLKPASQTAP
jgi:hypothetical protein